MQRQREHRCVKEMRGVFQRQREHRCVKEMRGVFQRQREHRCVKEMRGVICRGRGNTGVLKRWEVYFRGRENRSVFQRQREQGLFQRQSEQRYISEAEQRCILEAETSGVLQRQREPGSAVQKTVWSISVLVTTPLLPYFVSETFLKRYLQISDHHFLTLALCFRNLSEEIFADQWPPLSYTGTLFLKPFCDQPTVRMTALRINYVWLLQVFHCIKN